MRTNYDLMTLEELEREAYRTDNKLALALLVKIEETMKKELSALFPLMLRRTK